MEGPGVSAQSSLIGATIGNYRVVAKLGEGGMGSVYLAEHPLIGKKVALKVLHDEYSANQDVVSRFFNEAKAVNDIQHPNIVDIIDYGVVQTQTGPGFVYFIMEFLGGEALASAIQRESPMPPERAFPIAMQVADALAASHAKGIIHRDLKPDNIYLITRGREKDFVKVLDFGIAKLTGDAPGSRRTRTGIVMGTPAYMSPEQCEGKGNIDARTDVYALGIVLYEMITGQVPFAGEGYGEVLVQHLTKRPARPISSRGAVAPHVEAVIMKTLEKKREDRFQTMEELIEALRDPQGYIDARGGLDAFYRPSDGDGGYGAGGPLPPGQARTPYPGAGLPVATPGAGVPRAPSVVVGSGVDPGPSFEAPARNRMPLFIGGAVVAVALVVGGIVLATRGGAGAETAAAQAPAPVVDPGKPAEPGKPAVDPEPSKPVDPPVVAGSKTISISVTSAPVGADVFVGAETLSRGKTPLELELPRSDGESKITVRAEGYKEAVRPVKLSMDAQLEISLAKDRRRASGESGSGSAKAGRDGGTPGKTTGTTKKPPGAGKTPNKPGSDDVLAPVF